jgi:hypothetical protein
MPGAKKAGTVIGVFQSRVAAEDAILELKRAGFADSTIGFVARNEKGEVVAEKGGHSMAEEGLAAGAVVGAGAGALVGLGVLAGTIPVIGPILALGTLGTILLNAVAGAAVVGLVGALMGWGIPEEDARFYEEEVRGGRFLVSVDAGNRDVEAWAILHRKGAYNRTYPLAEPGMGTRRVGETISQPTAYPLP